MPQITQEDKAEINPCQGFTINKLYPKRYYIEVELLNNTYQVPGSRQQRVFFVPPVHCHQFLQWYDVLDILHRMRIRLELAQDWGTNWIRNGMVKRRQIAIYVTTGISHSQQYDNLLNPWHFCQLNSFNDLPVSFKSMSRPPSGLKQGLFKYLLLLI